MYRINLSYRDAFGRIKDVKFTCKKYTTYFDETWFEDCVSEDNIHNGRFSIKKSNVENLVVRPVLDRSFLPVHTDYTYYAAGRKNVKSIIIYTKHHIEVLKSLQNLLSQYHIPYGYNITRKYVLIVDVDDTHFTIDLRYPDQERSAGVHSDYVLYSISCSFGFVENHKSCLHGETILDNAEDLISVLSRKEIEDKKQKLNAMYGIGISTNPAFEFLKPSIQAAQEYDEMIHTEIEKYCRYDAKAMKELFNNRFGKKEANMPLRTLPAIKKVIFNKPYTIVLWVDGTKTMCKATKGTAFREEAGLSICFMKKAMGLTNTQFGKLVEKYKEENK